MTKGFYKPMGARPSRPPGYIPGLLLPESRRDGWMSRCELPKIRFPWARREGEDECWEWVAPRTDKPPLPPPRPVLGIGRPETDSGGWMSRCELPLPKFLRRPNWKIGRFDVVELKRDICNWPAGTRGTVFGDEDRLKVVEIADDEGRMLALLVVPEKELELVAQNIWTRVVPDPSARIAKHDVVELKRNIAKWPAGTRGAVVSDHELSKLIEISDARGQMLDLIEVAEWDLELVEKYS